MKLKIKFNVHIQNFLVTFARNVSATNLSLDIIVFFSEAQDYFGFEIDGVRKMKKHKHKIKQT